MVIRHCITSVAYICNCAALTSTVAVRHKNKEDLFFQVMILGHFCLKDRCSILRAVATVGLVAGVILVFEPQNFMVAHYEVVQLLDLPAVKMGSAIKSCCT